MERCSRPKPEVVRWRALPDKPERIEVACSECHWSLYLLEYVNNDVRVIYWRHASPPVAVA